MKLICFKIQLTCHNCHQESAKTVVHCLKIYCLQSGLLLEFVKLATILEQIIKMRMTITHSILNMHKNITQDISDKILRPFSHCKHFCHCSCDIIMLIHCAVIILGTEGESVTLQISGKMLGSMHTHIFCQVTVPQL